MAEELEHEPQPQQPQNGLPDGEAVPTDGAEPQKKEKKRRKRLIERRGMV